MRRAALVVLPLLVLAGCAFPVPVPASGSAPAAPPAPAESIVESGAGEFEALYLDVLHGYDIPLTDDELLTIGPRICAGFDDGNSYGQVERAVLAGEPGLTTAHAGYLVGASVGAFCQEHAEAVPGG